MVGTVEPRLGFTLMRAFQYQGSGQTLAQGIEEYSAVHPGLVRGSAMSAQAQHFFRCHDVVHVVYGCSTGLDDEAVVKVASIFGTTAGFRVLEGYRLREALDIYQQLRIREVLPSIARSVVVVPRTVVRCLRQRARWPWSNFEEHLDTPLAELRRNFGIKVAHDHGSIADA
jgi:ubiquinone biosynthesis protein Coq4